jgi:hypothetical protein
LFAFLKYYYPINNGIKDIILKDKTDSFTNILPANKNIICLENKNIKKDIKKFIIILKLNNIFIELKYLFLSVI